MSPNAKITKIREVQRFTLSIRLRCRISNCSLAFWKRACSLSSAEVSKYTSTSLVGRGVGGTETKWRSSLWELKLYCALGRKPSSGLRNGPVCLIPHSKYRLLLSANAQLLDTLVHLPYVIFIHQAGLDHPVTAAPDRPVLRTSGAENHFFYIVPQFLKS